MYIIFSPKSWQEYIDNQSEKQLIKKTNELIKELMRGNNTKGTGKAELLKHNLSGYYSKRITEAHRLIYSFENGDLLIYKCRGHYEN
ncbi:Toxin YoeB [Methanimicrococcus hongohii]|uniref:Putative mRNA interferase YoeB n=1 Tax=Methanimicrococcus hongohii TaxID=3028295 RepID=A0AA96UY22_9EURY|nr:Txe/YoeB family addiction module toxin [Methanimicrococcus sp. Hf6]WNY22719.1 Toxin YoeB [Methanimicrococcus sp. Hf6]